MTISLPYVSGYWYPVCILTSQPYFSLALVTGSLGSLLALRQEVLCFSIHMVSTLALIHPIRGSHLYVACWSVSDRDQKFWSAKSVPSCLIIPSKALAWLLDFLGIKSQIGPSVLDPLIFTIRTLPWFLDRLSKGLWSLNSILFPVVNASAWDIQVTSPCPTKKFSLVCAWPQVPS